jgi:hypothetical protein
LTYRILDCDFEGFYVKTTLLVSIFVSSTLFGAERVEEKEISGPIGQPPETYFATIPGDPIRLIVYPYLVKAENAPSAIKNVINYLYTLGLNQIIHSRGSAWLEQVAAHIAERFPEICKETVMFHFSASDIAQADTWLQLQANADPANLRDSFQTLLKIVECMGSLENIEKSPRASLLPVLKVMPLETLVTDQTRRVCLLKAAIRQGSPRLIKHLLSQTALKEELAASLNADPNPTNLLLLQKLLAYEPLLAKDDKEVADNQEQAHAGKKRTEEEAQMDPSAAKRTAKDAE